GEELERARQNNQQLLADLKDREAALLKAYNNKIPPEIYKPIQKARQEIDKTNQQNDEAFQNVTRQLFRTLYHEAFHAYLANFVSPPADNDVPRWLNEGLAQVFENAFIEGGELRVGQSDRARLAAAQAAARNKELVSVADLLRSGPKQFVVLHA